MKQLSIAIVDTFPEKNLAQIAINMALRIPNVKKVYTFADEPYFSGADFIKIPKINTSNQYSEIVLEIFPNAIEEEFLLVIQWDGFPLISENWREDFLKYDYIGAPLNDGRGGVWIGNGGFSLRSRKLLGLIAQANIRIDKMNLNDQPEDELICINYRQKLESMGVLFAPYSLATQFSYQALGVPSKNLFGFHGAHNFPIFISEVQLMPHADDIISRLSQPLNLLMYLQNCHNAGMFDLVSTSVKNYLEKPNLIKALSFANLNMPNLGFNKLIEKFN